MNLVFARLNHLNSFLPPNKFLPLGTFLFVPIRVTRIFHVSHDTKRLRENVHHKSPSTTVFSSLLHLPRLLVKNRYLYTNHSIPMRLFRLVLANQIRVNLLPVVVLYKFHIPNVPGSEHPFLHLGSEQKRCPDLYTQCSTLHTKKSVCITCVDNRTHPRFPYIQW